VGGGFVDCILHFGTPDCHDVDGAERLGNVSDVEFRFVHQPIVNTSSTSTVDISNFADGYRPIIAFRSYASEVRLQAKLPTCANADDHDFPACYYILQRRHRQTYIRAVGPA
jgi:hypothetical protein